VSAKEIEALKLELAALQLQVPTRFRRPLERIAQILSNQAERLDQLERWRAGFATVTLGAGGGGGNLIINNPSKGTTG
jgi:hypothetical protein